MTNEAAEGNPKGHIPFNTMGAAAAGAGGLATHPSGGPQNATIIMPGSETGSLEGCEQGTCPEPGCCGGGQGSRGYGFGKE